MVRSGELADGTKSSCAIIRKLLRLVLAIGQAIAHRVMWKFSQPIRLDHVNSSGVALNIVGGKILMNVPATRLTSNEKLSHQYSPGSPRAVANAVAKFRQWEMLIKISAIPLDSQITLACPPNCTNGFPPIWFTTSMSVH